MSMKNSWMLVPYVLLAACGSSGPNETLTAVTTASATACPGGGVTITTGVDSNDNGMLDASEVTATQNLCNGTNGNPGSDGSLVITSPVLAGDANCPNGGTEIQTGVDNGAGGGTAGDGILQAGEVTSTQYVCNGGPPLYIGSTTPPASPAGQFTIDTSGGDGAGSNASAGDAGNVIVTINNGTLGGAAKIFATGEADASFTIPDIAFNPGGTPMTLTDDVTLTAYESTDDGINSSDAFFAVLGDGSLYANIGGQATTITGIDIPVGVTLTLALSGDGSATVALDHDIRNAGNLVTAATETGQGVPIQIFLNNYLGAATSTIDCSGVDGNSDEGGGNGGGLKIIFSGTFINQGTITTNGGSGSFGGAGGNVVLTPNNSAAIYNTGDIDSHGGDGAGSNAGHGGAISLVTSYGDVNNSGALTANGGSGGSGGTSGDVLLQATIIGSIRNSGDINAAGGACTLTNCNGGNANKITFDSEGGGVVINDANITNTGGSTGVSGGSGGSGGGITISACDCNPNYGGDTVLGTGSIQVSGTITTTGGSGSIGGSGGRLDIELTDGASPHGQEIILLGYTQITLNGGSESGVNGTSGSGGQFALTQASAANGPGGDENFGPAGAVINYANITARSGDGVNIANGGGVALTTQPTNWNDTFEIAANVGDIDVSGGSSSGANGGRAGSVIITGTAGVQNSGVIVANGGDSTAVDQSGGLGGTVELLSGVGPVQNSGAITTNGGTDSASQSAGGGGGNLLIAGEPVTNSGALTCDGGDGGGDGGNAGSIELRTTLAGSSTNTGALVANGGTGGDFPGSDGIITVDSSVLGS